VPLTTLCRFEASEEHDKKKGKVNLIIHVSPAAARGIVLSELAERIEEAGKKRGEKKSEKKVSAEIKEMS
jgi:hypothetical protein